MIGGLTRSRLAWGISLVGLALGAFFLHLRSDDDGMGWTTEVPAARAELMAGLEDLERRYFKEAVDHFERAIELDADFVAAKLMMFYFLDPESERGQELADQLRQAPKAALNERERFLVAYRLARIDGETDTARELLGAFEAEHPEDAWGIMTRCDEAWDVEDMEATRECLGRLVELYPNWSMALGRLGIVSMADGQFEAAEELFDTARYIAPDQASPHDALGQLYALTGRYEESEEAFVRAIEVKGDYCDARSHLSLLHLVRDRLDQADAQIDRLAATEGCAHLEAKGVLCGLRAWSAYFRGDLDSALDEMATCTDGPGVANMLLGLRLAIEGGRWEQVAHLEGQLKQVAERWSDQDEYVFYGNYIESQRRHAAGLISIAAEDWDTACDAFRDADRISRYWGMERGMFKLTNRRYLAVCLDRTRHPVAAELVYRQIEAVNPRYLEEYPNPGVGVLSRFIDQARSGEPGPPQP